MTKKKKAAKKATEPVKTPEPRGNTGPLNLPQGCASVGGGTPHVPSPYAPGPSPPAGRLLNLPQGGAA
jgi:hypothetical protein